MPCLSVGLESTDRAVGVGEFPNGNSWVWTWHGHFQAEALRCDVFKESEVRDCVCSV